MGEMGDGRGWMGALSKGESGWIECIEITSGTQEGEERYAC